MKSSRRMKGMLGCRQVYVLTGSLTLVLPFTCSLYWESEPEMSGYVTRKMVPFPIFRGRGKGLAHSHRRSRSGLHPI